MKNSGARVKGTAVGASVQRHQVDASAVSGQAVPVHATAAVVEVSHVVHQRGIVAALSHAGVACRVVIKEIACGCEYVE